MSYIEFPVAPSTAKVRTTVAGDVNTPVGQIADGTDPTQMMKVHGDGSILAVQRYWSTAIVIADAAQPTYSAGDLVGSITASAASVPQGYFRLVDCLIADLSGAALPAGLSLALFGYDPTADVTSMADGDPLAGGFSSGGATVRGVDAATIAAGVGGDPLYPNASVVTREGVLSFLDLAHLLDPSFPTTPYAALVATAPIASTPGMIAVAAQFEYLGSAGVA